MAFKMKGNPYQMGKIATKSAMEMKTSYKMKEAMAKMKSPMELKKDDSSMKKYKSDAQRKAVHASKAERGMTMKKEEAMKMKKKEAMKMKKEEPMKMKKPLKAAKPDYIDLDGDGNKTESMKQAAADKKSGAKMKKKVAQNRMKKRVAQANAAAILAGNGTKSTKKVATKAAKEAMKMKKGEAMKMKKEAMKMKKDPAMKAKFDDNPKDFVKVPSTGEMVKPNNPKNITEIIKIIKKGEQTPGTRNQIKKLENKRRKLADKEGPAKKA